MKNFKKMYEVSMSAADAFIPHFTADIIPKKKRKTKPLTRNYIEVAGKRVRRNK